MQPLGGGENGYDARNVHDVVVVVDADDDDVEVRGCYCPRIRPKL